MNTHWVHITASYGLVLGSFLALAIATMLRHAAARRRLAGLDPRAARRGQDTDAARRGLESDAPRRGKDME